MRSHSTEPQAARRFGHAGRQADGARSIVLASRIASRVRLRTRVSASVSATVSGSQEIATGPARHPRQGGQVSRPAADAIVPGRTRAPAQGVHQPGDVRTCGAALVAVDAPARPAGGRPVRKFGVPHERRRAPPVYAVALRGRKRVVHHERRKHCSSTCIPIIDDYIIANVFIVVVFHL